MTLYRVVMSKQPEIADLVRDLEVLGALVPVVRCEHGFVDKHWWPYGSFFDEYSGYSMPTDYRLCQGAGLEGDTE